MSRVFKRMGNLMRSASVRDLWDQLATRRTAWFLAGTFIFAKMIQIYDKIKMCLVLQRMYIDFLMEHKQAVKQIVTSRQLMEDIVTSQKLIGDKLALEELSENDFDEIESLL